MNVQRTITLHLPADMRLVKTIETVNAATNDILVIGFDAKVVNKLRLHHLTYYPIRERFPGIPSSLVTTARDNASEMLKRDRFNVLPTKKRWSAIRYNQRTFTPELSRGFVTLSSMEGRVKLLFDMPKCFQKYIGWKAVSANLSFDGRKLILGIVVEGTTPSVRPAKTVLGVDTGIINHAVLSNNKFHSSSHIRSVKGRYQYLRGKLQAKGTASARRKLKRLAGKDKRFMADANHRIAKWIVNQPFDAIALEKLVIRRDKSLGTRFNRMLGNWAFSQLRSFVEYKAESLGKAVIDIDAMYTSQKCSKCGAIDRRSRQGRRFKCTSCGFELHSDLNAARNIASLGIAEAGRPFVNGPIVTSS